MLATGWCTHVAKRARRSSAVNLCATAGVSWRAVPTQQKRGTDRNPCRDMVPGIAGRVQKLRAEGKRALVGDTVWRVVERRYGARYAASSQGLCLTHVSRTLTRRFCASRAARESRSEHALCFQGAHAQGHERFRRRTTYVCLKHLPLLPPWTVCRPVVVRLRRRFARRPPCESARLPRVTSCAMSSSAAEKEQALLKKRLEAQLKLPHNQTCADCPSRRASPRLFFGRGAAPDCSLSPQFHAGQAQTWACSYAPTARCVRPCRRPRADAGAGADVRSRRRASTAAWACTSPRFAPARSTSGRRSW